MFSLVFPLGGRGPAYPLGIWSGGGGGVGPTPGHGDYFANRYFAPHFYPGTYFESPSTLVLAMSLLEPEMALTPVSRLDRMKRALKAWRDAIGRRMPQPSGPVLSPLGQRWAAMLTSTLHWN